MLIEGTGTQPLAQPLPPPPPPPSERAERVLAAEDDTARAEALTTELETATAQERTEIIAEIGAQDPEAFNSWLSPTAVNQLVADGVITDSERGRIAEATAAAYNDGRIPTTTVAEPGILPGQDNDIQAAPWDSMIQYGYGSPTDITYQQNVAEFHEFFGSSSGPETAEFRLNYAGHLTDTYALNGEHDLLDPARESAAAVASQLVTGDPTRPGLASEFASQQFWEGEATGMSDDFTRFMELASAGAELFDRTMLQNRADDGLISADQAEIARLAQDDPITAFARSISTNNLPSHLAPFDGLQTPESGQLAVGLVELTVANPELDYGLSGLGGPERLEAVTAAVSVEADAVLNHFTTPDTARPADDPDRSIQQAKVETLGAFFDATLFNQDVINRHGLQDAVIDYAGELHDNIQAPGVFTDSVQRMGLLSASMADAVRQNQEQVEADAAAREERIGFVVDLALTAVPGDFSGKVTDALSGSFTNEALNTAVQGVSGQLIDTASGRLTDSAKSQIVEALGDDAADVLEDIGTVNGLLQNTVGVYQSLLDRENAIEGPGQTNGDLTEEEELEYLQVIQEFNNFDLAAQVN